MSTRDFAAVIRGRLTADRRLRAAVQKERLNGDIAQLIYDARVQAGLTQRQLAEMVDTHQSVIARLEDADYGGHSLRMLQKIAVALDQELIVNFKPLAASGRKTRRATSR